MKPNRISLACAMALPLAVMALSAGCGGKTPVATKSDPAGQSEAQAVAAPAAVQPSAPAFEEKDNLVFSSPGGLDLALDLDLPLDAKDPRPLLIYVSNNDYGDHAPDFSANASWKGWYGEVAAAAASRGYVAAAVNYRPLRALSKSSFPYGAQVDDVRAAANWLRAHAADYHIDPTRIALLGIGAGAHLAMGAAYGLPGERLARPAGGVGVPGLKAVMVAGGTVDMAEAFELDKKLQPAALSTAMQLIDMRVCGGYPEDKPANYRAASPILNVSASTPPTLSLQAGEDTYGSLGQAKRLAAALDAAKVRNSLVVIPGAKQVPRSAFLLPDVWSFLDTELDNRR